MFSLIKKKIQGPVLGFCCLLTAACTLSTPGFSQEPSLEQKFSISSAMVRYNVKQINEVLRQAFRQPKQVREALLEEIPEDWEVGRAWVSNKGHIYLEDVHMTGENECTVDRMHFYIRQKGSPSVSIVFNDLRFPESPEDSIQCAISATFIEKKDLMDFNAATFNVDKDGNTPFLLDTHADVHLSKSSATPYGPSGTIRMTLSKGEGNCFFIKDYSPKKAKNTEEVFSAEVEFYTDAQGEIQVDVDEEALLDAVRAIETYADELLPPEQAQELRELLADTL